MTVLIETVRIRGGKAPLWPYHLVRLARSAKALGVTLPTLVSPSGGEDRVMRYAVKSGGFTVIEREIGSVAAVKLGVAPVGYRPYPHKVEERGQFDQALEGARETGVDDVLLLVEGAVAEIGRPVQSGARKALARTA